MTDLKIRIENYCRCWRFKQHTIPRIQQYISNYLANVLNKEPTLVPVGMSATQICLRRPDDINLQDGLDVRIDWFANLKTFEDAIDPSPKTSIMTWLFSDMMRAFRKASPRIFSRENFENYYFYFDYHMSAEYQRAKSLLDKYQNIVYHDNEYNFISDISTDNTIFFNNSEFCSATPKEIAKVLSAIDKLKTT